MATNAHHLQRLSDAKAAADKLHSDSSVTRSTTRESLEELVEHIEHLIETIDDADDE